MKRSLSILVLLFGMACSGHPNRAGTPKADTLVVYEAASLAGPMRAALDTFVRRSEGPVVVLEEHGASLELARKITELHRTPDVIALADQEVFPQLLIPGATRWYAAFARNRMVIAYTPRSRHAAEITPDNWRTVLQRRDVLLGRTDPVLAPAGYRALLAYRLAEVFYHDTGLAARLEARTPPTLMRGNAAELAALLSAGELDYIIDYESLARAQHFPFVSLPPDVDLGDADHTATYAEVSVRVRRGTDTVELRGAPILYGVSLPRSAPHPVVAQRFLQFLLGPDGRAILRASSVDALDQPMMRGDSIPAGLAAKTSP